MQVPSEHLISRLRKRLSKITSSRFVRFLFVGVGNTIFGYAVFAGIYFVMNDHRIAIIGATAIGIIFNFFTTGRVVFGSQSLRAAIPFIVGYAVVLGLNLLLSEAFIILGLHPMLAQATSLPFVVLASYFINAKIVFRARHDI